MKYKTKCSETVAFITKNLQFLTLYVTLITLLDKNEPLQEFVCLVSLVVAST